MKWVSILLLAIAPAALCVAPAARGQEGGREFKGKVTEIEKDKSWFIIADEQQPARRLFVTEKTKFTRDGKEVKFDALKVGDTLTVGFVISTEPPPDKSFGGRFVATTVEIK
jgi:hypothetical protein